jgi:membrane protease YdiL (CAAX protease family)
MIAILDGKSGLKLLLKRLLIWRVGIGYWLFATLFLVPVILLSSLFNSFINSEPVSFSNLKLTFNIVPMFIAFTIVTGLGQELGWTGFLLPRLQSRFGALVSSLLRATLVVLWHIPLLIYSRLQPYAIPDFPYGEWINEKGFLITLLAMVMLSLPWSIFFTWLFNNTQGSLLLVSIFHGSEIWLVYLMGISSKNLDNLWGYGLLMLIAAIIIVIVMGSQNLSRKHKRIAY